MDEIFVSTDVEADGPIPGPYSMLSLGSAAYTEDGALLDTFSANLLTLPGAGTDPGTMAWWAERPEAWEACRRDARDPAAVMGEYAAWLEGLPGIPVFVGYPASFDFMCVYWYLQKFAGRSPFSFVALDLKTFAWTLLDLPFRETVKRNMPKRWFGEKPHDHVALNDALAQGDLFFRMLRERRAPGGRESGPAVGGGEE